MKQVKERPEVWAARVAAFQASGQWNLSAWFRENGVAYYAMRYHVKKAKKLSSQEMFPGTWLQLAVQEEASPTGASESPAPEDAADPAGDDPTASRAVWLHVGGYTIEVRPGFDPTFLREVVRVVTRES